MQLRPILASLLLGSALCSAEPALKPGDHVAIIGDSITEQKLYSRFMEMYLLASSGVAGLDVAQFGWGGERAPGFANRCKGSLEWFKPTVATTCYGMNDGSYTTYTDAIGTNYRAGMVRTADELAKLGVREMVLGSPGVVDSTTWRNPVTPLVYNANLATLGGLAKSVAEEKKVRYADVHHPMLDAMAKAKAAYGDSYHVGGGDGVHPSPNGHLVMAAAFLTALGCDGEIARITLTADGKATTSAGHTVAKAEAGAVELDSARWPFVLTGNDNTPNSTRSIAPHTDFIERLDRFVVAMPDCTWGKVKITWDKESVVVDGAQVRQGVNLMAVFTATPFDRPSDALAKAVAAQQELETSLVKGLLNVQGRGQIDADPASKALFQQLIDRQVVLRNEKAAAARAAVVAVHHRIALSKAE